MKGKYVKVVDSFFFQQFNFDTKKVEGLCTIPHNSIGIWIDDKGYYLFEGLMGTENIYPYDKKYITPTILPSRLPKDCEYTNGYTKRTVFNDDEDREITERLEKRLFAAKTQIDVDIAYIYASAAQADRLGRKLSIMGLNNLTSQI